MPEQQLAKSLGCDLRIAMLGACDLDGSVSDSMFVGFVLCIEGAVIVFRMPAGDM